jgi:hypothetical protein
MRRGRAQASGLSRSKNPNGYDHQNELLYILGDL